MYYIKCPYYKKTKTDSICCESGTMSFRSEKQRHSHIKHYCESEWGKCHLANKLNAEYERMEIKDMAKLIDQNKTNEIERLKDEIHSLKKRNKHLTDANNKIRGQIADLREEKAKSDKLYQTNINSLISQNSDLRKNVSNQLVWRTWLESLVGFYMLAEHNGETKFKINRKDITDKVGNKVLAFKPTEDKDIFDVEVIEVNDNGNKEKKEKQV